MIDLESQVAAFQLQAAQTKEQKSAKGTIDDTTEASLSPDSQHFLMKQVGLNTTGPSTLFTCGLEFFSEIILTHLWMFVDCDTIFTVREEDPVL